MQEIQNYDSQKHKNTILFWEPVETHSNILGGDSIEKSGCRFYCNNRIAKAINFKSKFVPARSMEVGIYFQVGADWVSMAISDDAFKVDLILARISQDLEEQSIVPVIEEAFGKRTAVLLIPSPKVSSFKNKSNLGHCRISIESKIKITFEDLGAKNLTYIKPLNDKEMQDLQYSLSNSESLTITESSLNILESIDLGTQLKPKKPITQKPPIILSLSKSFKILIV